MESLVGKNALVTGSSKGIGRATALALADKGVNVAVNYCHDASKEKAFAVAEECKALGVKSFVVKADVSRKKDVEKMFALVAKEFGGIDLLVNNAGIFPSKPGAQIHELSEEEFDKVFDVNVKGMFFCTQEALKIMLLAKGVKGRIVNVSSVAVFGSKSGAHYAAAKSAVIGFTRSIVAQYSSRGIVANVVVPGPVKTDLLKDLSQERMQAFVDETPLGRLAEPQEIADAIVFLLSHSFVNGQCLIVDGGRFKN